MSEPRAELHRWRELPATQIHPAVARRAIMATRVTLAQFELEPGALIAAHEHDHEQLTYVEAGHIRVWLGADESQVHDVRVGEVLHIPPGLRHRVEALARTRATDFFCPRREDWLDSGGSSRDI